MTDKIDEIIITKSSLPLIRVGWPNFIFLFLLIFTFMSVQIFNNFSIAIYLRAIIFVSVYGLLILWYLRSVSRIQLKNKSLIFTKAIGRTTIKLENIEKIKVKHYSSFAMLTVSVKIKQSFFPTFFYFVTYYTNVGWLKETKLNLEEMLSRKYDEETTNKNIT